MLAVRRRRPAAERPTTRGLSPDLSISLAGLDPDPDAPWSAGPRAAIEWAATQGFRSVQLDATAPGVRPRELDRSGRRDLAALLRRLQLRLSGLDLWIPSEHFADPARAERAHRAAVAAMDLAADLARLVEFPAGALVSLLLPAEVPAVTTEALAAHAENRGVDVADHAFRESPRARGRLGIGIDPAALLLAGRDPPAAVTQSGQALKSVRLSDATSIGRVAVGAPGARLDVLAYKAMIEVTGFRRDVVLDLRGVRGPAQALTRARSAWEPAF